MVHAIPLTNFATYKADAQAIQRTLRASPDSPETLRQAVGDLTGLCIKGFEEAAQVFEALALLVLALHPDVTRASQPEKRAP